MLRVGSDFSGVGAFDFALKRLGINFKNVFACEMDKFARQTYLKNHGKPDYYPTDVYKRDTPPDPLDIYMTSPPCQTFSLAGNKKGKKDNRGILFFNSHQFIKDNKPRYFIFENVIGLLYDDNGRTFQEWKNYLGGKSVNGLPVLFPDRNAVPYHIYYKEINARDLNVPQNRLRVFIIGIRDDVDNVFAFPKTVPLEKKLENVLDLVTDDRFILSAKMLNKITYKRKNDGEVANLNKGGERGSVYDYKTDFMSCLSATDFKQPKQIMDSNKVIRRLTPRECFRLMDFPDSFTWDCSNTQAYKQAGNSIVVKCLEKIIEKFRL
jgi:DNA (cytosine-5)-methyltransferase 1